MSLSHPSQKLEKLWSAKKNGPKSPFSIASDIWSLGLTIVELALGKYAIPAPTEAEINELMSLEEGTPPRKSEEIRHTIFELLMVIVDQEPPKLPNTHFSQGMVDFIDMCLQVRKGHFLENVDRKCRSDFRTVIRSEVVISIRDCGVRVAVKLQFSPLKITVMVVGSLEQVLRMACLTKFSTFRTLEN